MNKPSKQEWGFFGIQVGVWAAVILLPVLTSWLITSNGQYAMDTLMMTGSMLQSPMLIYFLNFYVFDRWLFQPRHYWWFALANLVLMVGLNWGIVFWADYAPQMPAAAWLGMAIGFFVYFLLNLAMIAAALGIRHFMRIRRIRRQLQEEQARRTEAELAWLKNQINPHFLFNTLNNISSLAAIDGEATQEAIAQLSDLLRYAMYETNKKSVPLQGEVDFMQNYISLMKLRVGTNTVVSTNFGVRGTTAEIAPLLFISIIENAFKHGISSNRPSYIIIRLKVDDGRLDFECRNSNFPKTVTDRSGSGIGIENTRRRLDLLYPGAYTWQQGLCDNSETYFSHITITL